MRTLSSFRTDRRGNVAATFALALLPILGMVGAAVDYSVAVNTRTKIEAALDTAVLLATSKSEYTLDQTAARTRAQNMFAGQINSFGITVDSSNFTITDTVTGRTATGTATATVNTYFMRLMGFNTLTVSGNATAQVNLPVYVDFYLLLDNSPSMGVAATTTDIATMVNNTSDKCAFACHDTYTSSSKKTLQKNSYYDLAKKLGVTTRIDVVRQSTQALMDKATATAAVANQFRMAIYTLGSDCSSVGLTTITPLTASLSSAKSAASAIDLMTIPYAGYNNDQCTDFDNVISAMNTTIPANGDGSSGAPFKYMFFVSDGVADAYYPTSCTKTTTGGRCQEPLTISTCNTLKARGVKIAVLYTT